MPTAEIRQTRTPVVFNKEEASHLKKVDQDDMDELQIQSMQETEVRCKQGVPSSLLPSVLRSFPC